MKRHRPQKPTRKLTPTERRSQVIAKSVSNVNLKGTHDRPTRQEWAESRKRSGWTPRTVDDAIGAASLNYVRAVVDGFQKQPECRCRFEGPRKLYTCRWCRAVQALPVIDTGRHAECGIPRQPEKQANDVLMAPPGGRR